MVSEAFTRAYEARRKTRAKQDARESYIATRREHIARRGPVTGTTAEKDRLRNISS